MKISKKDTKLFSIISGDKNKIHLSKRFAKNNKEKSEKTFSIPLE